MNYDPTKNRQDQHPKNDQQKNRQPDRGSQQPGQTPNKEQDKNKKTW